MMYLISIAILLMSCGDPKEGQDPDTASPALDTNANNNLENPCLPPENGSFMLTGSVEYTDGQVATNQNTQIQLCLGACLIASWSTEEEGHFCVKNVSPGDYSFGVFPSDGETYASPIDIVSIKSGDTELTLEPIKIPSYDNNISVASTEFQFEAGGGLTINVDPTNNFNKTNLFATNIDVVASGLPLAEFEGKTILGLWYLGPATIGGDTITGGNCSDETLLEEKDCTASGECSDTTYTTQASCEREGGIWTANEEWTKSIWSFEVDSTENNAFSSISDGEKVSLYNISYLDHKWLEAGTATMGNGKLISDDESGITLLSVLLMVAE